MKPIAFLTCAALLSLTSACAGVIEDEDAWTEELMLSQDFHDTYDWEDVAVIPEGAEAKIATTSCTAGMQAFVTAQGYSGRVYDCQSWTTSAGTKCQAVSWYDGFATKTCTTKAGVTTNT